MQHQGFHMPPLVFLTEIHQKQHFSITAAHQTPEGNPKQLETKPTESPHSTPKPTSIYIPIHTGKNQGKNIQETVYLLFSKHIYGNKAQGITKFGCSWVCFLNEKVN